ncbi:MAG: gamma-glutamylcyclotransferase [Anaerolineae bacterium]|nr:gamma-glutamylcyclotransferase [Anaerolineae bacterium]
MSSLLNSEPHHPLFVYGTLRPGQSNYGRLVKGRTLTEQPATLEDTCLLSCGSFPMAVAPNQVPHHFEGATPCNWEIRGELLTPHPFHYVQLLYELDDLEDYHPHDLRNSMYHRVERLVRTDAGAGVVAWVYLGNPGYVQANYPLIPDGDWVAFRLRVREGVR